MFMPQRITKKKLQIELDKLISAKKVVSYSGSEPIYALGGHGTYLQNTVKRRKITQKKLRSIHTYVKMLQKVPQVSLIGLSGSCTMGNATKSDDVDIFIIARPGRLWTARLIAVLLAYVYGVKRQRNVQKAPNKVCLNMFFDAMDMGVPVYKQNAYTGHEVLQMKPLSKWVDPDELSAEYRKREAQTYTAFIVANKWVYSLFPNAKNRGRGTAKKTDTKAPIGLATIFERMIKSLQLWKINKHKTTEIITDTQLWFFPKDFQKKVRNIIS